MTSGARRVARFLLGTALLLAALAWPAAAVNEASAPLMRSDVVRVWHSPESPAAHGQWNGGIQLTATANITQVYFQVCEVGNACFAPPSLMASDGHGNWTYDTTEYKAGGYTIDYQAGWHVGVQFQLISDDQRVTAFPDGPEATSSECQRDMQACAEQHYFTFIIAEEDKDTPSLGLPLVVLVFALAGLVVRRR